MTGSVFIGTSGWKYKHWDNTYYPKELPKKEQLNYYCSQFSTVELNNSFYRQPSLEQFINWNKAVPREFVFAVKAHRFFTQMKKLNVQVIDLENFLSRCDGLALKLGPVLFQLPPKWNLNIDRLAQFLAMLPRGYKFSMEFRNHSWYVPEVYALLERYNVAFCIYELDGHLSPLKITANFIYVRLHGPGAKYQGNYSDATLNEWAEFIKNEISAGKDVYLYFDNDEAGHAAFNAKRLNQLVNENIG